MSMFTMPSCRISHGFMGRKKVRLQAFKIHLRVNGYHAKLQRLGRNTSSVWRSASMPSCRWVAVWQNQISLRCLLFTKPFRKCMKCIAAIVFPYIRFQGHDFDKFCPKPNSIKLFTLLEDPNWRRLFVSLYFFQDMGLWGDTVHALSLGDADYGLVQGKESVRTCCFIRQGWCREEI